MDTEIARGREIIKILELYPTLMAQDAMITRIFEEKERAALFAYIHALEAVAEAARELLADLDYLDIQIATIGEMRQALSALDAKGSFTKR
jgi:hypothetical protein